MTRSKRKKTEFRRRGRNRDDEELKENVKRREGVRKKEGGKPEECRHQLMKNASRCRDGEKEWGGGRG